MLNVKINEIMKQEEFMESIYGCLERIENKINGLSMPQSAGGDAEADKEVIQELNALKTGFKRVLEALVMIKGDTSNLLKRNSMPDSGLPRGGVCPPLGDGSSGRADGFRGRSWGPGTFLSPWERIGRLRIRLAESKSRVQDDRRTSRPTGKSL